MKHMMNVIKSSHMKQTCVTEFHSAVQMFSLLFLFLFLLRAGFIRGLVGSTRVNIVYTEDSSSAIPSVRLCDHK
jgi:hypothetical protein